MNQFEKAYQEERRLAANIEAAKTEEEQFKAEREYEGFKTEVEDLSTVEDIAYTNIWLAYSESRRYGSKILVFQGSTCYHDIMVQILKANRIREFATAGDPEALKDALEFAKAGCKITGVRKVITFKDIYGKETRKPALLFRIL